jgi:hypothetical protein
MTKELLDNLWFTARWFTGWVIDLFISFGGIYAMIWAFFLYKKYPIQDIEYVSSANSTLVALGVSLGIFSAIMAGRAWARAQYFTHIMPEVWTDTVKNFIKQAKEQKEEKDE